MSLIDTLAARFGHDFQRMAEALDRALAENSRLRLDNANLREENRHLRRLLSDHDLRMLRRAHRDALLIGALHYAGGFTSRRQCAQVGMGENRWCLARALMRRARVLRGNRIVEEQAGDFEIRLLAEVRGLETSGGVDALRWGSYRHRMPRKRK